MSTVHNEAKNEDIAKTVIMPGDPLRCKYIAEKYLTNYKLVNNVRGMLAYTGYYKDKKITIMAHGMGCPSIGIYSYELFKFYDVDEIIRIGSCGAITKKVPLRSVILVNKVYSKSNYAIIHNNDKRKTLSGSKELNEKIINTANNKNIKLYNSNVYCTDCFYTDIENYDLLYKNHGCVAVEMESFALFHNADILNKKASCILTVSDNVLTKEELSSLERQNSFDEMITLALDSTL